MIPTMMMLMMTSMTNSDDDEDEDDENLDFSENMSFGGLGGLCDTCSLLG